MKLYLIGSLRNPRVPEISKAIRDLGYDVFDDWFAAGPHADDAWRDYEKARGHLLPEALEGYAARHVFEFDKHHLETSTVVVLVLPAGKSGHLELGWALGRRKYGFILLDEDPNRYDVMYAFANGVYATLPELLSRLQQLRAKYE